MGEADEWRKEESQQARDAMKEVGEEESEFADEIRSAVHDVLKPGHDRDYRGFALFYQDLFCRNKVDIRAFGLRNRDEGVYPHCKSLYAHWNGWRDYND